MEFRVLLQVFRGLWLMEDSEAAYWADFATKALFTKTADAIPGFDPREYPAHYAARGRQAYRDIYRVDQTGTMNPEGQVQVIGLRGPLMETDYCGSPGMQTMQQVVRAANADPSIQSIVLYIDSPGGTVSGTHNLAREIGRSAKPVVTFTNKMMCSAAYWIGASASEVIADDENAGFNSMIGSIGTKATYVDRTGEMEKQGLVVKHVYATKSSRKGKYSDDLLSGNHERLIQELDAVNEIFHAGVKSSRGEKLKLDAENVLEGDIYNAKDSIKFGLIDKMGSFETAVKRSLQLAKTIRK